MEIYDCKVLLGGSRTNEVRKFGLPAAEIIMLRHIHGEDMVVEIVHAGTSDITDAQVRDMLALSYGPGDVEISKAGPAILKEVFGPAGVKLPSSIDEVEHAPSPVKIKAEKVRRLRDIRPEDDVFPAPAPAPAAKKGVEAFND